MLPRSARLHRSADFTEVVRRGRRASRPTLTVHAVLGVPEVGLAAHDLQGTAAPDAPVRAGLVVSKAVGGSVVRSTVSRRLRHLLRDRLTTLPPGSRLVVRAAPSAAGAPSARLAVDLDEALARLQRPAPARRPTPR